MVRLEIEPSDDERRRYLSDYFAIPSEILNRNSSILTRIYLNFSITVRGKKEPKQHADECLILKEMKIMGCNEILTILRENDRQQKQAHLATFQKGKGGGQSFIDQINVNSDESLNQYIQNVMEQNKTLVEAQSLKNYTSLFQWDFLNDLISQVNFVGSNRESLKESEYEAIDPSQVDTRGDKLVNLIDTMHTDNNKLFQEITNQCKRIFPDIIEIRPTHQIGGKKISIIINKTHLSRGIKFPEEASGLEQLLIIIWKIATSTPNTIWFLDEPELHLHAGAQQLLYDFLKKESVEREKQIFVATHSMVFIHKSRLNEVSIILNQERGNPSIASLEDLVPIEERNTLEAISIMRDHVYQALGYEPRFSFESEKIILVEGKTDKAVLTVFSNKLELKLDPNVVNLIPLGDRQNVEKYSPILIYTLSNKKCLIILDNDKKDPESIRNQIKEKEKEYKLRVGSKPILKDDNFMFYPNNVYSIEHYLLNAKAICKAAYYEATSEIMNDIQKKIDEAAKYSSYHRIIKPKDVLRNIWESLVVGPYDEVKTAVKIAECLSKDDLEKNNGIKELIIKMSS